MYRQQTTAFAFPVEFAARAAAAEPLRESVRSGHNLHEETKWPAIASEPIAGRGGIQQRDSTPPRAPCKRLCRILHKCLTALTRRSGTSESRACLLAPVAPSIRAG